MSLERTAIDAEALAELYDAHGHIAREAGPLVDALRAVLDDGVAVDHLEPVLRDCLRRAERIHAVAATERERWYRS